MPTRDQFWRMHDLFRDDDRIGHGGFESPSGRQWYEPERSRQLPEFTGARIGYMTVDPVTYELRLVRDWMLEDFTDGDDQDWIDFNPINKQ